MSRPGSSVIGLTPDQYNSSLNSTSTSTSGYSSQYSSTVSSQYNGGQHSPPGHAKYSPTDQYSGHTSPVRKYSSGSDQYSSMHYASTANSTQYIPVPCTVKSSPVCQSDVSHEIIRPTPRRAGLAAAAPASPSGPPPHQPAYIVSVGGTGLPKYSPYASASPLMTNGNVTPLTIPVGGGRSSQSPPTRHQICSPPSTPVSAVTTGGKASEAGGGFRGASDSPFKPQIAESNGLDTGGGGSHHRNSNSMSNKSNSTSNLNKTNNNNNNTVRLGSSPFWCGVGSRDPLSRKYEYPERDVPPPSNTTSATGRETVPSAAAATVRNGSSTGGGEAVGAGGVNPTASSLHVTNLVIEKTGSRPNHNLNLPVPSHAQKERDVETAENEDDDSGGDEHPAVRQGRSSLIKYKANHKSKPKRKFVSHLAPPAARDKMKRHDHVVKHGAKDHAAKQYGTETDTRVNGRSRQSYGKNNSKLQNGDIAKGLEKASQLLEVKAALEQLSFSPGLHSSTSTYSSMSDFDSELEGTDYQAYEDRGRKCRASSQETLSTTVTSADEFVWIDSHNRLVEVQHVPWNLEDLSRVLQHGTLRDSVNKVARETLPRLSYYMQRLLVRIARETQRLAQKVFKCSKYEVMSALRIVLSPVLASSCIKGCLRAGAMYNISSDQSRQTKSSRAGLNLDIGKVHQWMCTVKIGKFIQEYAAVYLTAGLENILEEVLSQCLLTASQVTVSVLETCIANSPELWGIFQPYAHLSSCRTAKGTLTVPRCQNLSESETVRLTSTVRNMEKSLSQILLTTCVGSKEELEALVAAAGQFYQKHYHPLTSGGKLTPSWSRDSLHSLYHYMRCSQLENQGHDTCTTIQELVYERPYMVLPPLIEWYRVATVFSESRFSSTIQCDDVFQSARVLLPGADYPPRGQAFNMEFTAMPSSTADEADYVTSLKRATAFQLLLSGRRDLIPHALQMLPATKLNTTNEQGLTPLMVACLREEVSLVKLLLETGATLDARNPGPEKSQQQQANPEQTHWTALHYATVTGNYDVVRLLLEKGANVEGSVDVEEDICTETPLQLASAAGKADIVELLLSFGASPFLSTLKVDAMSFGSAAQKGCYCALSTAASHGQRKVLHKLVTHPSTLTSQNSGKEVLSLEEILAEGVANGGNGSGEHNSEPRSGSSAKKGMVQPIKNGGSNGGGSGLLYSRFTKSNVKRLQEAMYHSTESGNIDITLDLRNFGVPWSLHSWIRTLITAHQAGLTGISDELLQDFSKDWTEDNSAYFTDECLPVLVSIFKSNKSEGTTLLLADVLSACYGKDPIHPIAFPDSPADLKGGPRIDPKFVNNPDLSDIQFRVEGRIFYAHKLVLITSSYKFRSMLNSKFCEGSPPILQINDIRYEIFEMVMQYLYKGSAEDLRVEAGDILELMAAANFFQLEGLLHYCECRCADLIDLDTIVSYYIHAKVYSAGQLLVYAEGFLLQNLVALLTYDDSVKRLIFGKKLQNHDVLSGLLRTLQDRVRRRGQTKSKKLSL